MPTQSNNSNHNSSHNPVTLRDMVMRHQENCDRIEQIADLCERENRERTDAEETEYRALRHDNELISMRAQAFAMPVAPATTSSPTALLREAVNDGRPNSRVAFLFRREEAGQGTAATTAQTAVAPSPMTTAGLADTGIIPVSEQEMLRPIRTGLIYDKVGLSIRTGLSAGKLRWAKHTKAVAQFADEAERLTDSKIDFDKLSVTPRRLGIAIPVTREEIESSEGVVEAVIREEMPAAVVDTINEAMFTTSKTFTDKNGHEATRKIYGPFVKAAETPFEFAADVPTRRELLKMKAQVLAAVGKLENPCFVMTENMKAELEDVKVDAGSGRFICENDTILGYPVFTTPAIGEGNVGFGDWSYQAAGFFGQMSMLVDPYTLARQNSDDFVLNAHFATVTLREEAFVLGHKKSA